MKTNMNGIEKEVRKFEEKSDEEFGKIFEELRNIQNLLKNSSSIQEHKQGIEVINACTVKWGGGGISGGRYNLLENIIQGGGI